MPNSGPSRFKNTQTDTSTYNLLVIDDDEGICDIVQFVAKEIGYNVAWTDRPEQFESLFSCDLDIIVMDLHMPDVDSNELIRFLANNKCKAKLILLSEHGYRALHEAETFANNQGLNVLDILQKPIQVNKLKYVLEHPLIFRPEETL